MLWEKRIDTITSLLSTNEEGYYTFGKLWAKPGRIYDTAYDMEEVEYEGGNDGGQEVEEN
jgi:hypothetical protein